MVLCCKDAKYTICRVILASLEGRREEVRASARERERDRDRDPKVILLPPRR